MERVSQKAIIMFIIVENKATNLIPVRILNIAFDFCFRRVTEEGYHPSKSTLFMQDSHERGFRSVYSLTAHAVFVTKYRRKVINSTISRRLKEIFTETCQKWNCKLQEFNGESDHVHLLISYPPQVQLSKLIANLKNVSRRLIRKESAEYIDQFYRSPVFWTGSYFVASCGGVTIEQLKKYVEQQSSPNI